MQFALISAVATVLIVPRGIAQANHSLDNGQAERFRGDEEKAQFIQEAVRPWNNVDRWLIEYEGRATVADDSIPVHKVMAVSAQGGFYHMVAHFPGNHAWQMDPFQQEFFIRDGKTCHRWPFNRTYSEDTIKLGDVLPGSTWMDVLLSIIPRWPLTQYRMPTDPGSASPVVLVDAVASPGYRLLIKTETISGEECVIFDNAGIDRLWVTKDKGLCLMRRERRDARSKRLIDRIITDKLERLKSGIWLPTDYRVQFFRGDPKTDETLIERENRICVLQCLLNEEVEEAVFIPVHAAGSLKFDEHKRSTQVSAGGRELLDQMVDFIRNYAKLATKSPIKSSGPGWIVGGAIIGMSLGLVLLPRHRGRQTLQVRKTEPVSRS